MRSYLSLIPISAKVHRRQNRMTLLCIIFAVFLVTAIFSMADMLVQSETMHTKETHGNWHIQIQNIAESEAQTIRTRTDVAAASWYDVVNLDQSRAYTIDGRQAALCGIEEPFRTDIMRYFDETSSVQADDAAILTPNAKELLGVTVGDSLELDTPAGSYTFRVTGFRSDGSRYANNNGSGETTALLVDEDQVGVFINISAFRRIMQDNGDTGSASYYVQFGSHANMKKAIAQILVDEGFVKSFTVIEDGKQGVITVTLKYAEGGVAAIKGLKRVSKPGLRIYSNAAELPKVMKGLGTAIISTSKGVMTDREARKMNIGGEVLAFIW